MYLKIWYSAIIRLNCKRSNFDAQKSQILQFWLISSYPYFHSSFWFRSQNDDFRKLCHTHNVNVTLDINETIFGLTNLRLMSDRHKLQHASHYPTSVGHLLRYRESLKRFEIFFLPKRGVVFWDLGFPTLLKNFKCLPVFRFF